MTQDLLWSRILSGSESLVGQDMQVKRRCAQKGGICLNRGDLQLFMTILEENNLIKAAARRLFFASKRAGVFGVHPRFTNGMPEMQFTGM